MLKHIVIIEPRGFCAGVRTAIDTVVKLAQKYSNETIYVKHKIVHNSEVIRELQEKYNVVFVEEISEIPNGARVVFSAHGTSPKVYAEAKERNLKVTDATCMLVEKVHFKAREYAKQGVNIVIIGHNGHQEIIGTMGQAKMHLVENIRDVENLNIEVNAPVAYITQTTLSIYETKNIELALRKKFSKLISSKDDICYATTNRQEAVIAASGNADFFIVIGDESSSNSRRLVETVQQRGVNAYLISSFKDIKSAWFLGVKSVGITAGASAPEYLLQEVVKYIKKTYGGEIETYIHKIENVNFPEKILV